MARSPGSPDAFSRMCPSREVMERLGEKWTMLVIVVLEDGPMRFGELRRKVEGISQKMLSQTTRNLERDGLISRQPYDEKPLRVEYELTQRGSELVPIVHALKRWAERHLHDIKASGRHFDSRSRAH